MTVVTAADTEVDPAITLAASVEISVAIVAKDADTVNGAVASETDTEDGSEPDAPKNWRVAEECWTRSSALYWPVVGVVTPESALL